MVSSQASASIAPTIEVKKQIEELSHKRYVLSVVSGQESIVIENLKERAKKNGLDEDIIDYLAPVTNETIMRRQKKVIKQRKLYPGYVFVKSRMNDKIWYVIRNTPGVRIIVGAETHPIPLSDAEYQNIVRQIEEKNLRSELVVPFQEGDVVIMRDGNFTGMKGVIKDVDVAKGCATVHVEILGRLTPVTLDFDNIELIS